VVEREAREVTTVAVSEATTVAVTEAREEREVLSVK